VEDVKIVNRVSLNTRALLLRCAFAAWAGLFAAFPVTLLPLVVIIHATYDPEHVFTVLKNVPRGLGAVVAYCAAIFLFYPTRGVVVGTLIAYAVATIYLILIQLGASLRLKRRPPDCASWGTWLATRRHRR
jgi:hypothetical protein